MRSLQIFIVILLLTSCGKKNDNTTVPRRSFPVVKVDQRDINGYFIFPSEISGVINIEVKPKISGYIEQVFVDEGQTVRKGQKLFKIEANIQAENASAAQASVSSSLAAIESAKANVKAAQVEVDKLEPLVERDIISSVQLETARAELLKAKGQLSKAQADHQIASAAYQGVLEDIKFSEITSPINGVVGRIYNREGSLVKPTDSNPITTISDVSEIYAYFSINEQQYINFFQEYPGKDLQEKINLMPPIELELANGSIFEEKGKLQTTSGQINPQTGTIQFRVKFDNDSKLLNQGSTGLIRIPRKFENVLVIPETAVFEQQGISYVYTVRNDSTNTTPVKLIDRIDNLAIVESGLKKGEVVVAMGANNLRHKAPIKPKSVDIDSLVNTLRPVNN
ncbi:efflux RND transporter periplasmic adaptor subunit [Flammeovirgaceae bacterium KN852]|uniref:Efflux RND transporter periplasmic adaptor subunit n=1 Tax=Marinigracilibium pacificum TaxID=2729599 RepID=A0A848IYP7_9BACT|nr:efflux RND transporter periplasmic adaptor subunit [Marinigracilibium pacificum]